MRITGVDRLLLAPQQACLSVAAPAPAGDRG
jgi:hypothetical protein